MRVALEEIKVCLNTQNPQPCTWWGMLRTRYLIKHYVFLNSKKEIKNFRIRHFPKITKTQHKTKKYQKKKICYFGKQFEQFCPVTLIAGMHTRGYFFRIPPRVMHNVLTPKSLCEYILSLAGRGITPVHTALIKTHSHRLAVPLIFPAMGMNPDLPNYLGRRKVKESSLRYFRASARHTLSAYRTFFTSLSPPAPHS